MSLAGIADELTSDAITASFRITQRRRGHRFSLDDLATAWIAAASPGEVHTALDLGCGIGSVLLMLAFKRPEARMFGVEAQAESFALAEHNVAANGIAARTRLVHGDLREVSAWFPGEPMDLVTGTPPYLPIGSATPSPDPQRAAARIELRGGVEDYLRAAARVLAPHGRVVVCADGRTPERVRRGAQEVDLTALHRADFVAREGDPGPLFSVWTLARGASEVAPTMERVVMRDRDGARTETATAMRAFFGLTAGG